jgi:hypothetical protein
MNDLSDFGLTSLGITIMCGIYFDLVSITHGGAVFSALVFLANLYFVIKVFWMIIRRNLTAMALISKLEEKYKRIKLIFTRPPKQTSLKELTTEGNSINKPIENVQKNSELKTLYDSCTLHLNES